MSNIGQSFWDFHPEAIEELKRLWAKGVKAGAIAVQLDPTRKLTRNAVIGKARRMGLGYVVRLVNGQPVPTLPAPKHHKRKRLHIREDILAVARKQVPTFVPGQQGTDLPFEKPRTAVSLFRLQPDHCRWPVGEPEELLFCGAKALPDTRFTFCPCHYKRAIASTRTQYDERKHVPFYR